MRKAERDTKTDVPRRIYESTIKRMDKHLEAKSKPAKTGKKTTIKGDFNEFLILLLDTYEAFQSSPKAYAVRLYEDVSEARGEAIKESVKTKTAVKWPKQVVIIGEDEV